MDKIQSQLLDTGLPILYGNVGPHINLAANLIHFTVLTCVHLILAYKHS